ncbi:MAG: tRNA uridine-5-carboxymethylaminomethyl(34) synthesis GTPase MnmE [Kiritimatiellaeota bacterium]|nr:tRNA uridine-5-carboxymethylaminomethyl(34) synthesis GTPase MnmE [Kiritimatiellota bacterium]
MMTDDTIAAIATASGEGGIAIIRISGPQALAVADRIFRCQGAPPSQRPTHTITWGHIDDQNQPVDEGLLLIMRAPQSYTREDVVELQCHGGSVTPRQVLRAALQAGARMAEPGEFTCRAFLNGRIDLVQAESVNDLIRSRTDRAVCLAMEQMEGRLSRQFNAIYQYLVSIAADLEATLDFPDDELPPSVLPEIAKRIGDVITQIGEMLKHWQDGHRLREGLTVVIAGRPNVGKSSLLNALLGKERAIVSHEPGTTRDFIEELYLVDGIQLRLIDTAGLRETACTIEQEGVRRTYDQLKKADLYLYLIDSSAPIHADDTANIKKLPKDRCILVLNKIDLRKEVPNQCLDGHIKIETSILQSIGLEYIKDSIKMLIGKLINVESIPSAVISERHYHHLNKARHELRTGLAIIENRKDQLIAAHHVRQAIELIGEITGNNVTDDILSAIFSKFCVGK